jgi:TolA-binding protein
MAPSASGSGHNAGPMPQLPDWVAWLQAGLTALLAVLFLVMLGKARVQGERIQELQERVQGLQNSRALERTTGLEQQLRSTVERLQALERSNARIDVLSAENSALRGEVRQLRRSAASNALPSLRPEPATGTDSTPSTPPGGSIPTPPPVSPER